MNNEQFLKESHQYLDSLFEGFYDYKKEIASLMDVFIDLCNRNQVRYFLTCGTLLGLVRDGGSIPWDYDADVAVPIYDLDKLLNALKNDLPKDYYFESNFTHPTSQFYQIRLLKKNTNPNFVHVDVFYFIGAPDNVSEAKKFSDRIKYIFRYRFYYHVFETEEYKSYSFLGKMYAKLKFKKEHGRKSKKYVDKLFNKTLKEYDYEKAANVALFGINAEIFPKDYLEPITTMEVNKHVYNVPAKPEKFLSILYRNYKEYLPIDNRFHEFYSVMKSYNEAQGKTAEVLFRNDGEN